MNQECANILGSFFWLSTKHQMETILIRRNTKRREFLLLFLINSVLIVSLSSLTSELITNDMMYSSFGGQMSTNQIDKLIQWQHDYTWVNYLTMPFILYIKILLITSCIYLGLYLFNVKDLRFNSIALVVLKCMFIFIIALVLKLFWFGFFVPHYTMAELQQFYPFSLQNVVHLTESGKWLMYPMQVANIFELAFFVLLSLGIKDLYAINFKKSLEVIALSYGSGMLAWACVVMFAVVTTS